MKKLIAAVLLTMVCGCTPAPEPAPTSTPRSVATPSSGAGISMNPTLEETVQLLAGDIGERNLTKFSGLEQTRSYIEARLKGAGYEVELQSFSPVKSLQKVHNVIATVPGNDEILVIGAHYDTAIGTPGADDNASGVAVLLQLAEHLKTAKFERTVRFVFFTNEEPPYFMTEDMGSRVYAKACSERGEKIIGMICLDSLGYYTDDKDSQRAPEGVKDCPTIGNFLAFVADPNSEFFMEECLQHFEGVLAESLVASGDTEGVSWSDHASFWEKGYPAVLVTDTAPFRSPHYHRPTDTADTLDYKKLGRAADGLEQVIRFLGREADLPGPNEE